VGGEYGFGLEITKGEKLMHPSVAQRKPVTHRSRRGNYWFWKKQPKLLDLFLITASIVTDFPTHLLAPSLTTKVEIRGNGPRS